MSHGGKAAAKSKKMAATVSLSKLASHISASISSRFCSIDLLGRKPRCIPEMPLAKSGSTRSRTGMAKGRCPR